MHFVDDIDFKLALRRRELYVLPQCPYLVYAAVRSAVNLDNIKAAPLTYLQTRGTSLAGFYSRAVFTVKGLSENTGGRGLAYPSGTGKDIGMGETVIG
jgi:hypothetical protein